MPRYRCDEPCVLPTVGGSTRFDAGSIVDFDGVPAASMAPLDAAAALRRRRRSGMRSSGNCGLRNTSASQCRSPFIAP